MHDELRVAGSSPQLSAMIAAEVSTSLQVGSIFCLRKGNSSIGG